MELAVVAHVEELGTLLKHLHEQWEVSILGRREELLPWIAHILLHNAFVIVRLSPA